MKGRLKSVIVAFRPSFISEGYGEFKISIRNDADENSLCERFEIDHFKSLGELAFDNAVRKFKHQMGWKP